MLKTRDRLIEVAHRLFLLKGVENTTMRDIADASDKGRRTLYTYFKSKGDIFDAVINREGEVYLNSLEEIASLSSSSSLDKLQQYIRKRFEVLGVMENHHNSFFDWFRNGFRSNVKRGILSSIRQRDSIILNRIITEGINNGEFDRDCGNSLSKVLPTVIRAAFIAGEDNEEMKEAVTEFILNAIKKKPNTI